MVVSERTNFADIYLRGMRDRRMRSGTKLAREIQLTDWSTSGNLSNRSAGCPLEYKYRVIFVLVVLYEGHLDNKSRYIATH